MANARHIEIDVLRQLLVYDAETGKLFWRERGPEWFSARRFQLMWNTRFAGKEAGTPGPYGYPLIELVGSTPIAAHRIAWAIVRGYWPTEVDHINGVPTDNRMDNLREVSHAENQRNVARGKANTSGVMGVSFVPKTGKWRAYVTIDGRQRSLGHHESKDAAVHARARALQELGFHPNHGRG